MNDFSQLEAELRKLRPVPPSENLMVRIESALAEQTSTDSAGLVLGPRPLRINWFSLGLEVAAGAALLLIFAHVSVDYRKKESEVIASRPPASVLPSKNTSAEFVPANLTQVVYHTRDEGLHFAPGLEQPLRRLRSQTRETLQWRNPATGASLRVSYPSEEVSLVPVSGQ